MTLPIFYWSSYASILIQCSRELHIRQVQSGQQVSDETLSEACNQTEFFFGYGINSSAACSSDQLMVILVCFIQIAVNPVVTTMQDLFHNSSGQ